MVLALNGHYAVGRGFNPGTTQQKQNQKDRIRGEAAPSPYSLVERIRYAD